MGEGEDVPYRPTDAKGCRLGGTRARSGHGARRVGGAHARAAPASGFVRRYQRCLNSGAGRKRRCYARMDKRCVRPVFLGRCWLRDRFFRRRVAGYRCTERRLYEVEGLYEGRVMCRKGRRRVSHSYTLLHEGQPVAVDTESELRAAWGNPRVTAIDVTADIFLRACELGDPMRESARPVLLDGHGHTLRQTCFEKRLLRQDGTGFVELRNVTLTRGGSDGPGGAVTTRGEIAVIDSKVKQNLAEEPGGGIMSQRRATIVRSVITGNLANDDGGGVYARRGGIQVYDSIVSANLVDGSGGALGSTGRHPRRPLARRRQHDRRRRRRDLHRRGRRRHRDRLDRERQRRGRPGRRDLHARRRRHDRQLDRERQPRRRPRRRGLGRGRRDRPELDDLAQPRRRTRRRGHVVARRPMYVGNSTVSNNYAEGKGGGLHRRQGRSLSSTRPSLDNIAPVGREHRRRRAARCLRLGHRPGEARRPAARRSRPTSCDAPIARSLGFNVVTDTSCGLDRADATSSGVALIAGPAG